MTDKDFNDRGMLEDLDLDQPEEEPTSTDDTPDEQPKPEDKAVDTKPETSDDDDPEDDTTDGDEPDLNTLFTQYGFDRRFSDPKDMFEKVNGHVTRLEQERSAQDKRLEQLSEMFTKMQQQGQPPANDVIDGDSLLENPTEVLGKAGYVRSEDVQKLIDSRLGEYQQEQATKEQETEYNRFKQSKPDWTELEPTMVNLATQFPNIRRLPPAEAAEVLYNLAKPRSSKPDKVEPSNKDKKARANTSGGKASKQGGALEVGSPEWFAKTPIAEIEKAIGYHQQ